MGIIYGLFDPVTQELRYVGCTIKTVQQRLGIHLTPSSLKCKTHKNDWLKSLLLKGLKPEVEELETHDTDAALKEAEKFWIAYYRGIGCRLTNGTDGGDGGFGCQPSNESRQKLSDSLKEYYKTHPHNASGTKWSDKRREAMTVLFSTPEHIKKLSNGRKGMVFSEETKAKMSAIRSTPESRQMLRERQLGAKHSEETKRKMSIIRKKPIIDDLGNVYSSLKDAAILLGVTGGTICAALKGRQKLCRGRRFFYV